MGGRAGWPGSFGRCLRGLGGARFHCPWFRSDGSGRRSRVALGAVWAGSDLRGGLYRGSNTHGGVAPTERGLEVNTAFLLPALLLFPLIGVVFISLGAAPKKTALGVSVLNLIPGFLLSGTVLRSGEVWFGPEITPARELFPVKFLLGMDGLSLPLVWLTLVVILAAMGVAQEGIKREKEYFICLLLVGLGALGAFLSVDLFYFFSFHEVALIPTFLLIGIWGHGDRSGAAWRMTLYLMLGSLVLLVGLIGS
ncbi:MAG: hypothetical protein EB056_06870 [Verrucomicrobia bacterium]|nr:hypothetical protein [Verrucomicrobiota bacterium]